MRISATIFVILISTYVVNASVLDPVIENVVHMKAFKPPDGVSGMWKKKTIWKPRWVKEWKSAKVTKPVWRKVWSPVQIREWLPIPKPPPGWDSLSTPLPPVHPKPLQKLPPKDSMGHHSFAAHAVAPLWDPVPYPESQQPPPQPLPQPAYNADVSCGSGGCDNSPSHTFNHQQILEIIGPRYHHPPGHFQNPEYSETVNHLTRLLPEGNNWRLPQPLLDINTFSNLPDFLVPPKPLSENNFNFRLTNNKPIAVPFPPSEIQNVPRWIPLPPENKLKGHLVTKPPDHPYKFHMPEVDSNSQNRTSTTHQELKNPENDVKKKVNPETQNKNGGFRPPTNGDFIQEAQLVGEYHYSDFDLPAVKAQPKMKSTEDLPRHKPKRPSEEDKQKQTQTETKKPEAHNAQGNSHVQKKHIPPPNPNFQQQEAFIKEIFPNFQTPKNTNQTWTRPFGPRENKHQGKPPSVDHSSTKLTPILPNATTIHFNTQQTKEIHPIYKTPQTESPPRHRFIFPQDIKQEEKLNRVNDTTAQSVEVAPIKSLKPKIPLSDKTNIVQLVFATSLDYNRSSEDLEKSTTTEPYEVMFSSSLFSTTEAVTKSPVIIVTPANSKS